MPIVRERPDSVAIGVVRQSDEDVLFDIYMPI